MFNGWKAITAFILTAVVIVIRAFGILDPALCDTIATLLASLGLWALAAKGKRIEDKLDAQPK